MAKCNFSRGSRVFGANMRYICFLLLAALSLKAWADEPALDRAAIVHALNRVGFGPRPGDVERVARIGLPAYLELQLHPEQIDDSACDAALKKLETLGMGRAELTAAYYADIRNFIERQRAGGGMGEEMKMRYGIDPGKGAAAASAPASTPSPQQRMEDAPKRVSVRALGELQTAKVVRAVMSERQLQEVMVDFWTNHFNIDTRKDECRTLKVVDDREVIRAVCSRKIPRSARRLRAQPGHAELSG